MGQHLLHLLAGGYFEKTGLSEFRKCAVPHESGIEFMRYQLGPTLRVCWPIPTQCRCRQPKNVMLSLQFCQAFHEKISAIVATGAELEVSGLYFYCLRHIGHSRSIMFQFRKVVALDG